jgi:hypothetical protein
MEEASANARLDHRSFQQKEQAMKVREWDGRPITENGWVSGIPIEKYHSAGICDGVAVSSSNLRTCWIKSPAHMFSSWCENPDADPITPSRFMILGQAAHHLFLGEDNFSSKFVTQPETYRDVKTGEEKEWTYKANACKAWRDKYVDAGKVIVSLKDLQAIIEMAKSLAAEALVQQGLLNGLVECSGFFKDRETGLWCKCRPDVIPTDSGDFADLKTTSEVLTPAIQSSIRSYAYHQQGSLVWECCEVLDQPFESFTLMFIETAKPYCARAVPLTDDDLARGRLQNRAMLRKIKGCMDIGHWPVPGEGDHSAMPLGKDERERIDARLKLEGML